MSAPEPVPFSLPVPGSDNIDFVGVETVSYRLEGLLQLKHNVLSIEWTGTRTTEYVGFTRIGEDRDHLPVEWVEVPVAWITRVRLLGGWWRPRIELRAGTLDAFQGIPSARGGTLILKIARRDRQIAQEMALAIELAKADEALAAAEEVGAELDSGGYPRLGDA